MNDATGLYEAFHDTAEEAVFVIDVATGAIAAANAQAIRDTGYAVEELEAFHVNRLLRQPEPFASLGMPGDGLARWSSHVVELVTKDGRTIAVNVVASRFEWRAKPFLLVLASRAATASPRLGGKEAAVERADFPSIIGKSESMRDVCRLVGSVAKSDVSVLIQGESGTGKEIVANAIHTHSRRREGPWVKVNCAALTETLLESELFGHVKGAFTGAVRDHCGRFKQADGGSILLDEIGSMSLSGQAKLLRVLQEREFEPVGSSVTSVVNVRVIAATNADLALAVKEGRFREDLYYRLNVCLISIPPLRERKEDVALLAQHFLRRYGQVGGKKLQAFATDALAQLIHHSWPGNVRELKNAVEHAVIVEEGPVISTASLPMNLARARGAAAPTGAELGLREKLHVLERQILLETLLRANGIKKRAAAMLGIDPRNLPYLLRKHRLGLASEKVRLSVPGAQELRKN